jgi:integrase
MWGIVWGIKSLIGVATMPTLKRIRTNYPGVFYIEGTSPATGKPEKIFYIRYRKDGRMAEEKAGRQFQDDMTAARASGIRAERISGKRLSRKEIREQKKVELTAIQNRWTITRLWEEYKANRPNLKGIVTDQNRFDKHLRPAFGEKEPKDLAPLDFDRLRLRLQKTKSVGTVKNVLELLRRIINFAAKKNLCPTPGFTIEMPKGRSMKTEDLSDDQLSRLLEAIASDSNIMAANLMKMALFTGMRRGELFKLKWEDIDFDRGFIHLLDPKGGHDQKIPLNPAVRQLLENHPQSDSPYVFPGRGGKQRVDIKKQVNRIKERAGLPKDFRALHGLRHTYASMLASSGEVDLYVLQRLLTHKSAAMTQRYAHLRDEALTRASHLAGNLIEQAMNGNDHIKVAHLDSE